MKLAFNADIRCISENCNNPGRASAGGRAQLASSDMRGEQLIKFADRVKSRFNVLHGVCRSREKIRRRFTNQSGRRALYVHGAPYLPAELIKILK